MNELVDYNPKLCEEIINKVAKLAPLIHHITNWVTIYDCAQITRCLGALPVMAFMKEEVADMVQHASALVLNIGTLSLDVAESMHIAGKAANARKIPVILDVVGCGATPARTRVAYQLISELQLAIIKGNPGEIGAAAGAEAQVKGVEFVSVRGDIVKIAQKLATKIRSVVVVTGQTDIITDGTYLHFCNKENSLMGKVVGTGCMAASVLGAFASVTDNYFLAAVCGMNLYGQAGEKTAQIATAPLAFKNEFLDCLYRMAKNVVS